MKGEKKRNGVYEKQRESKGFMSGVLVLSVSTLIVKIIGLAYKIPMLSYLGIEGMGYLNSAYEIFGMLCVVATAGLPVALSILVSASRQRGDRMGIRRLKRSGTAVFLLLGILGCTAMILLSGELSRWIGNENARFCLVAIAPALLFVCLASAYRGYYQGLNRMTPTAVSQLIEAGGKLIFGILFASMAQKRGWSIPMVSAAGIAGISLGCLLSLLYLLCVGWIRKEKKEKSELPVPEKEKRSPLPLLLRISIPITLSSAVFSVTRLSDMALIMRRLQTVGLSVADANRIYGAYTTMAVPVFSLIPALITPVSLALVPQLSASIAGKHPSQQQTVIERALKMTTLLSIPAGMGVCVYAQPILSLLFSAESEAIALAAPLLSALGPSILFSGVITTTNAMLQSYRKEKLPIVSMAIGAAVKIVFAYWLIGIPSVGVMGAPISTFFCNGTVMLLNLFFLRSCFPDRRLPVHVGEVFYKPLGGAILSILLSLLGYLWLFRIAESESLSFLLAMGIATVSYGGLAILLGLVTGEDVGFWKDRKNVRKSKEE